jgi:hypothetical protein
VIVGTCIWAPLGHPWFAIIPAIPAAIFFLTTLFMFANKEELPSDAAGDGGEEGDADAG